MTKDEAILNLRPLLPQIETTKAQKPLELFQKQTLRPLLKQQNDLLLAIFVSHLDKHKKTFLDSSPSAKEALIAQKIQRDQRFRQFLIGSIVAWFTKEEWQAYQQDPTAINRRIIGMLTQRLQSQISVLEGMVVVED